MVLADGCFDPVHWGHVRYLRAAEALRRPNEPLGVRIAPAADILAKGRACVQTDAERGRLIQIIVPCDCYFDATLVEAITRLRPRLLVKGWDWRHNLPRAVADACEQAGTVVAYVPTVERSSSERVAG